MLLLDNSKIFLYINTVLWSNKTLILTIKTTALIIVIPASKYVEF